MQLMVRSADGQVSPWFLRRDSQAQFLAGPSSGSTQLRRHGNVIQISSETPWSAVNKTAGNKPDFWSSIFESCWQRSDAREIDEHKHTLGYFQVVNRILDLGKRYRFGLVLLTFLAAAAVTLSIHACGHADWYVTRLMLLCQTYVTHFLER